MSKPITEDLPLDDNKKPKPKRIEHKQPPDHSDLCCCLECLR